MLVLGIISFVNLAIVEKQLALIKNFHWPITLFVLSILVGLIFLIVLIYLSISGIHKKPVVENAISKIRMNKTRTCLWILLGILIVKILLDLYLINTLGDDIKDCVRNNPEVIGEYNKNLKRRIVLVYNNGTTLFAPEFSSCIKVRRTPDKKYYNDERRLLEDFVYAGIRYCESERLIIIYVETFTDQVKELMFIVLVLFYAIVLTLFIGWAFILSYFNRKHYEACVGKS